MTSHVVRWHTPVTKRMTASVLELVPLVAPAMLYGRSATLAVSLALTSGVGWLLLGRALIAALVAGVRFFAVFWGLYIAFGVTSASWHCHCDVWPTPVFLAVVIAAYALPPVASALFAAFAPDAGRLDG
jgi:hypothetical protein